MAGQEIGESASRFKPHAAIAPTKHARLSGIDQKEVEPCGGKRLGNGAHGIFGAGLNERGEGEPSGHERPAQNDYGAPGKVALRGRLVVFEVVHGFMLPWGRRLRDLE